MSDHHHLEDHVDSERRTEKLRLLIKRVDPYGVARLTMDVGEEFDKFEIEQMRKHMQLQGLA